MTLVYTCLPASDGLVAAGFSVTVAREDDRIPLAAFKSGEDASKWCDQMNQPQKPLLTQTASVTKT